jgi:hypothetical protein
MVGQATLLSPCNNMVLSKKVVDDIQEQLPMEAVLSISC